MKTEKNNLPAISVIIPMYNCERFVPEVLAMFSEQSFHDFELICVIDGATDNTEETVKKICETDHRFSYLVRENGGAGAARNTGIDHAKGKYIIFSDADDDYHKDYLLKLYETAEMNQADIAVCGAETIDYITNEKCGETGFNREKLSEENVYCGKIKKGLLRMVDIQLCNRIFLRSFLEKNDLIFSEVKVGNDVFFSLASIACAGRIAVINENLLTVRRFINKDSVSSDRYKNSHVVLKEWRKLYKWLSDNDLLKYYMSDYLKWFDISANYEMKSGINSLFAKDTANILNCDEPWKKLNVDQLIRILKKSLGKEGTISAISYSKEEDPERIKEIQARNEIIKQRNKNILCMQELIKKETTKQFGRNFDDLKSISPVYNAEIMADNKLTTDIEKGNKMNSDSSSPAISVIIPMYNCASYVSDVLSMFSCQSFSDFEVICVIDGATDDTEQRVKEFYEHDKRLRYTTHENRGVGMARNTGLEMAKGKYIIFSDADDEYSQDYLKRLYETAVRHDAQITICRYIEKNTLLDTENNQGFNDKILFENISYSHFGIDNIFVSVSSRVTNKLYNTKFLKENGLFFPKENVAEDAFFCYASLSIADRIVVLQDVLMNYRLFINPESLRGKRERVQHVALDVYRLLYQWLKEHSLLNVHFEAYLRRMNVVLIFESGHKVNPRFISEAAHMLNAEEPWASMNTKEILEYFKESLLTEKAVQKEKELSSYISPELIESDLQLSYLLDYYKNRVHNSWLLRKLSLERYGRDFECEDSLPVL